MSVVLTSTPTKAVILTSQCIVCAAEINSKERISLFGRSEFNLLGIISSIVGGNLQQSILDGKNSSFVCKKKCYSRLKKLEKTSSVLKNLERELKEEILRNNAEHVRFKRGLSQEYVPYEEMKKVKLRMPRTNLFHDDKKEDLSQYTAKVNPVVVTGSFTSDIFPVQDTGESTETRRNTETTSQDVGIKLPSVQVVLNYPECDKTYKCVLVKDLEPLGKALARKGTYKQIAAAAFQSRALKKCLISKTLITLKKECSDLCSRKKPSLLTKSEADDMKSFSLFKLCHEWKERAPLFYSFITTCSSGNNDDEEWSPAVAVAGSVLLKKRNVHMNATASLITLLVRESGIQVKNIRKVNFAKRLGNFPTFVAKFRRSLINLRISRRSLF